MGKRLKITALENTIAKLSAENTAYKAEEATKQAERDLLGLSKVEGYSIVPKGLIREAATLLLMSNITSLGTSPLASQTEQMALELAKFGSEKVPS